MSSKRRDKAFIILKSQPGDGGVLKRKFAEEIIIPENEVWGIQLKSLSCPNNTRENGDILKVKCAETVNEVLNVQAVKKRKFQHYDYFANRPATPLRYKVISELNIQLEIDEKKKFSSEDIHPSIMQLTISEIKNRERMIHLSSKKNEFISGENKANRFWVKFPPDVQLRKESSYQIALASISFNPFFSPLPYIYENSGAYSFTFQNGAGKKETWKINISELIDLEKLKSKGNHDIAHSILKNMFEFLKIKNGEELCQLGKNKTSGEILIKWLQNGKLSMPWQIGYLFAWKGRKALKQNAYLSVTMEKNKTIAISPRLNYDQLHSPHNLMIKSDFIDLTQAGNVIKCVPVNKFVSSDAEYITYEPANLEFHQFRFPEKEHLNFEIRTPEGPYAAFVNEDKEVFVSLIIRQE